MMRALLHLLKSSAPSPNAKQSFHPGQHSKPVSNATTASFAKEEEETREGRGGGFTLAGPPSGNI